MEYGRSYGVLYGEVMRWSMGKLWGEGWGSYEVEYGEAMRWSMGKLWGGGWGLGKL